MGLALAKKVSLRRRKKFGLGWRDAGAFRLASGFLGRRHGESGQSFLICALGVEFEESGEDFVADFIGPAVAPGFLFLSATGFFWARLGLVVLVIEEELAGAFGEQVGPAVGSEDGSVHAGVQGAQAADAIERSSGGGVKRQGRAVGWDGLGGAPIADGGTLAVEGFQPRQGLVIGRVKEVVDVCEA